MNDNGKLDVRALPDAEPPVPLGGGTRAADSPGGGALPSLRRGPGTAEGRRRGQLLRPRRPLAARHPAHQPGPYGTGRRTRHPRPVRGPDARPAGRPRRTPAGPPGRPSRRRRNGPSASRSPRRSGGCGWPNGSAAATPTTSRWSSGCEATLDTVALHGGAARRGGPSRGAAHRLRRTRGRAVPAGRARRRGRAVLHRRGLSPEELDARIGAAVGRPFDLGAELPLRAEVFRVAPDDHMVAIVLHHIATDEWSDRPFLADLDTAYPARARGRGAAVGAAAGAVRGLHALAAAAPRRSGRPGSEGARQLAYWTKALTGLPEEIPLPLDRTRPAEPTGRAGTVRTELPAETAQALRAMCADTGTSMFMLLHAAVATLLHRMGRAPTSRWAPRSPGAPTAPWTIWSAFSSTRWCCAPTCPATRRSPNC